MTNAPDETSETTESTTRSEVTEADGPVNGADAVPDKSADTPAKGAGFDDDTDATDASSDPRGDTSIRDQR